MARKTKLTPTAQKHFLDAIRVGAPQHIACDYAGISQQTLYVWMEKAEQGRQPYVEFVEQATRAQGRAAVGWLAKIEAAAQAGDWKAAAWKLERRFPEQFGRTIQQQQGPEGGPIQHQIVRLPVKASSVEAWEATVPKEPMRE